MISFSDNWMLAMGIKGGGRGGKHRFSDVLVQESFLALPSSDNTSPIASCGWPQYYFLVAPPGVEYFFFYLLILAEGLCLCLKVTGFSLPLSQQLNAFAI